jgi:sec-independent protein translocase protein TatA
MHSPVFLFLGNLFSSDMIIIVFVALILFGGEKLPEIARGLGKGIRDFKDASDGVKREINNQINSFEEKREEDKRIEQATAIQQTAVNSPSDQLVESPPPVVPNTMPVSDYIFVEDKNALNENHTGVHVEPLTENHADAPHTEAEATNNESIKN